MFLDSWRKRLSDIYNITINIHRHEHRWIHRLNLRFSKPVEKTLTVALEKSKSMPTIPGTPAAAVMTDTQKLSATITPEDSNGNVVPIPDGDLVVWTSSDPTVVTVTPSVDGLSAVCASVGKAGSVTISVVINSSATPPVAIASATGTIQVTPAGISQVAIAFGTPA
jgi:hypothetical protein